MQKVALEGEPLAASSSFAARLGALWGYMVAWAETCADYYTAASLYDELSGLSDAELSRRGSAATRSPATSPRPATERTGDSLSPCFFSMGRGLG